MLVSPLGIPLAPSHVIERLHQIDPDLGLVWIGLPDIPQWGVTLKWPQSDPRRVEIRKGNLREEDAHDILAPLPPDCNAEEAYGYITRYFKQASDSGNERARKLLDRVHAYNKQAKQEALRETTEYAQELLEANAGTLFRNEGKTTTRLFMNEPGPRKQKGRSL